jgi:hypothetical protein
MNEQRLSSPYNTSVDVCCMSSKSFRKVYMVEQRLDQLNWTSSLSAAYGNKLEGDRIYPIPMEINKRKFTNKFHVCTNLNEDLILGIDFFQKHRLGYDPSSQEL